MGSSWLYFENGLPTMKQIQVQFKKQTGLYIGITADLNLLELPQNDKEIVEKLSQDIGKYEDFEEKYFNTDLDIKWEENEKINRILNFQFYNSRFYGIDFHTKGNTIEMLFGIGRVYFISSLHKVLFDLGGRFVDTENKPIRGWENRRQWKRLKHWNDYKWYNRPLK